MTAPTIAPGLCECGNVASRVHACAYGAPLPAEPPGHAAGLVHPAPVPGCPWCPPVACPCGESCDDPAACRRRWAGSETTWREAATFTAIAAGSALYGARRWDW